MRFCRIFERLANGEFLDYDPIFGIQQFVKKIYEHYKKEA